MASALSKREIVLNAFRPGTAIYLPAQFAGRKSEISTLVDALSIDGSCPVVYGERGLGKSSLALQVERIALGDTELLHELGLSDRVIAPENTYITFHFSCTDDTSSKAKLLQGIINNAEGFTEAAGLSGAVVRTKTYKKGLKLKIYETEVSETFSSAKGYTELSVEEKLEAIIGRILDKHNKRLLFIIDELDRVRDVRGLASVIKKLSSTDVKFLLVGVGQSVSSLLVDHISIERQLVQVPVYLMRDEDCRTIVSKAESLLGRQGVDFKFSPDTVDRLVEAAGGFPWFIHTLGQAALLAALEGGKKVVTGKEIAKALRSLGMRRFQQQFYDTYEMAVGDSRKREIVLRLFAKWGKFSIPTSDIYPMAKYLGVRNPSQFTKQLTTYKRGRVLVRPPYAPSRVFRFTNAMFKQYVNLKDSIYKGVREEVDGLWESRRG